MTARLVRTVAGCVLLSLVLAGAGSLLLANRSSREQTRRDVRDQALALADEGQTLERIVSVRAVRADGPNAALFRRLLVRVIQANDVVLRPQGNIRTADIPPAVLEAGYTAKQLRGLPAGVVDSGITSKAWALSTYAAANGTALVLVTADVDSGFGSGIQWLLVTGLGALAVGLAAAWALGRRISAPVRTAAAAARAIADGDLSARVPVAGNDELAELGRAVNDLAARLHHSRDRERQLVASVSHDLRTPLTSIRGWGEAILDGTAPDNAAAARVIVGQSEHLSHLVGDLLDYARVGAGQLALHPEQVDIGAIVASVCAARELTARARDITLEYEPVSASAIADPRRVEQVIGNLVDNSVKFAKSEVRVVVSQGGATVDISVSDDGPGIPADLIDSVFAPFNSDDRGDPTRAGTGLGLAVAAELSKAMGATIAFDREWTPGARVTLGFPNAVADELQ